MRDFSIVQRQKCLVLIELVAVRREFLELLYNFGCLRLANGVAGRLLIPQCSSNG